MCEGRCATCARAECPGYEATDDKPKFHTGFPVIPMPS